MFYRPQDTRLKSLWYFDTAWHFVRGDSKISPSLFNMLQIQIGDHVKAFNSNWQITELREPDTARPIAKLENASQGKEPAFQYIDGLEWL